MNAAFRPTVVLSLIFVLAVAAGTRVFGQQIETPADAEILPLKGDLYEARTGNQYTIFLVTPDGILVGDPINYPFARWLQQQFDAQFTGRAVRYVVLSHHHFDRADGGTVFGKATVVAQERFNGELEEQERSLPAVGGVEDANRNGQFDPDELNGRPNAALVLSHDRNADGRVTKQELYSYLPFAIDRFTTRRTITLGGHRVDVIHTGDWHSRDMAALFLPDQRIVFAVDPPPVTAVPFSFGTARAGEVYAWLEAITPLDFDSVLTSDGQVISRMQVSELAAYLDAVRTEVATQYEQGRSLAQIQATAVPEQFRDSPQYAGRREQIAALYRTLHFRMFELQAVGVANYGSRAATYCAGYAVCTGGGAVPAATVGATFMFSRRTGVGVEALLSEQTWSTRTRIRYSEETALRQGRGTVLFRVVPVRGFALVAGPSMTFGDVRGMAIQQGEVPFAGRRVVQSRESRFGVAAGVDLSVPLWSGLSLVTPLRVNFIRAPLPAYWPAQVAAMGGVGLNIRITRRAN